jgi:hypothetical protein
VKIAVPPPFPRFQADFSFALKGMLIVVMVLVCMGVGWFLFHGPRRQAPNHPSKPDALTHGPDPTQKVPKAPAVPAPPRPGPPPPPPMPVPPKEVDPPPPTEVKPPPRKEPPPALTFQEHVRPILEARCISCHGVQKKRGGLDLRTLAGVLKGGDNGPSVKPGMVSDSPLWQSVNSGEMPPGAKKLSARQKKIIQDWIASGAKDR